MPTIKSWKPFELSNEEAIILFAFGSGPVKGFAITLGIGIITTLFTAYFLARHLTSLIVLRNNNKDIKI